MQSGVIGGRIGASIAQRWVRNHGLKGAYIRSGIGCLAFAFLMQLVFSVAPPDDPSNHRAGVILVVSFVVMGVGSFVAAFRARHLGFLNGRHHSRWDGRVRRLIRDGDLREAETLLRQMIAAAQTEGTIASELWLGGYYDTLFGVLRRQGRLDEEARAIRQYERVVDHARPLSPRLRKRLERLDARAEEAE